MTLMIAHSQNNQEDYDEVSRHLEMNTDHLPSLTFLMKLGKFIRHVIRKNNA